VCVYVCTLVCGWNEEVCACVHVCPYAATVMRACVRGGKNNVGVCGSMCEYVREYVRMCKFVCSSM
jgi:hypothetical protein